MAVIELASAVVRVDLNASQVFVGMTTLRRDLEREFLRLATALTLTSLGIRAAMMGMFPIKQVIASAAEFEQTRVEFEALLGSAEEGRAVLAELVEFARVTPFQLPGVESAAKNLIAFGIELEDVMPLLTMSAKVAAGTGAELDELTFVLGKMKTDSRAMAREINQLADRGIPLYGRLAEIMKVATTRIREMAREGEVGFGDVLSVMREMTTEGGRFATVMTEKSKTLIGLSERLAESFTILSRHIGEDFLEALKPVTALLALTVRALDLFNTLTGNIAGRVVVMSSAIFGLSAAFILLSKALRAAGLGAIFFAGAWRLALRSTIIGLVVTLLLDQMMKLFGRFFEMKVPESLAKYDELLTKFDPTKMDALMRRGGGEGGLRAGRESFQGLGKAVQDAMLKSAEPQRETVRELKKINHKADTLAEIRDLIKQANRPFGVLQ